MALAARIYKSGIELATCVPVAGSAALGTVSATNSRVIGTGRRVQVHVTGGGTSSGVYNTRVVTDGGATVTVEDKCPFV